MADSPSPESSEDEWRQEDHPEDEDDEVDPRRRPSAATNKLKNRATRQTKKKKIKEDKSRGVRKRSRSPEPSETGSGSETESSTASKKKRARSKKSTISTKGKKDEEDEETPKRKPKSEKKKETTKSKSTKSKKTKATGKPSKKVPKDKLIAKPKRNDQLQASGHYRQGHNVYLFIESHFTGDIWHLAGALLLLRKAREDLKNPIQPLPLEGAELRIAIMYWGSINGSNVKSGKWLWEYIKSLGFPVVFVRYAKVKGEGRQRQSSKRLRVNYQTFEDLYQAQQKYGVDQFTEAFTNYPMEYIVKSRTDAVENEDLDETAPQPVISTTTNTSIAPLPGFPAGPFLPPQPGFPGDPFRRPLPGFPVDPIIAASILPPGDPDQDEHPMREFEFVNSTLADYFTEGPADDSGDEYSDDDDDESDESDESDENAEGDKTEGDERSEKFFIPPEKQSFFGDLVFLPSNPTIPIEKKHALAIPMEEDLWDEKPMEKIPTDEFLWPKDTVAAHFDDPPNILPPQIETEFIVRATEKVDETDQRAYVINFDLSTTILMQCMHALGFDATWPWLSQNLWHVPDHIRPVGAMTNATVEEEADKLIAVLTARMTAASRKLMDDRGLHSLPPVILFAWRESKYNEHTNTHKKHYDFIRKLARKRTENPPAIVVISMKRENLKPSEAAGKPEVFNLYHPNPFVDRRIIACFWAKVAELQKPRVDRPLLHGLIGGRSGSLDIACYAGVNVIEWDSCLWGKVRGEPTLSSKRALGFKKKTTVSTQGPYNLRILNQQPMLWIVFMDNAHDDSPLVVPPSTERTFRYFKDVLDILESAHTPQEQVFPLEGRFRGDMPGKHLVRLGSSLKKLEAPWLGIRLSYLGDYQDVFDKWIRERRPEEGVGLDRAPKKKKKKESTPRKKKDPPRKKKDPSSEKKKKKSRDDSD